MLFCFTSTCYFAFVLNKFKLLSLSLIDSTQHITIHSNGKALRLSMHPDLNTGLGSQMIRQWLMHGVSRRCSLDTKTLVSILRGI